MIFLDLKEVNDLSFDIPSRSFCLSPETTNICLIALSHLEERWRWEYNGSRLTDAQWDEAASFVAVAVDELMTEGACS